MTMTRHGLAASGQLLAEDLVNLPGTVTTAASTGPFTTTKDLRDWLVAGDMVIFSGQTTKSYAIASLTSSTITLVIAYDGTTGSGQTMTLDSFRVVGAISPAPSDLSGSFNVTNGSNSVPSTANQTSVLSAGDGITFGSDTQSYRIRSVTSTTVTLEANYRGTTNATQTAKKANYTNVQGRFGAMALGTNITSSTATNTGLGAEIVSGGAERRSTTNVTTYLLGPSDSGGSANQWRSRWETTWSITSTFAVAEIGVFNSASANRGICLLRQNFATALNVVNTDKLKLTVTVTHSATSPGSTGALLADGLKECARLLMDRTTTLDTTNSWNTTDGIKFDHIAVGSSAAAVTQSQTALTTEIAANGLSRQSGDDTNPVLGTLMTDPPNFTQPALGSETSAVNFNAFVGDTVQWRTTFSVTGTQVVNEQGIINNTSGGVLLLRQTYAASLDLINTDTFITVIRVQTQ